jgi:uncharacterized membrane protein (UPF0127 family)
VGNATNKNRVLYISATVLILGGLIALFLFLYRNQSEDCAITLENRCIELEVAETPEQHITGLSGRQDMSDYQGMWFVFSEEDTNCMWMKDMNFPLDIVWLDSDKQIVHMESAVAPDSFPENFCSPEPSRYVIELKAGVAKRSGLEIGQKLNL